MRTYFIKTKELTGTTTLYTRIRKKQPHVDINVNTLIKVDVADWLDVADEARNGNPNAQHDYLTRTRRGKQIYPLLVDLDRALDNMANAADWNADRIKELLPDTVKSIVCKAEYRREQARMVAEAEALAKARKAQEKAQEARKRDVLGYLKDFVKSIERGERQFKNNAYTEGSLVVWRSFLKLMTRFMETHYFTWDEVDKQLVSTYTVWMRREGYMPTTINKYIVCFRAMVGYAYEEGYHDNVRAQGCFQRVKVKEEAKAREIYLTADELQALYEMPLDGTRARYRDVFLVGCYTCQRFSDYSKIEKENIYTSEKGTKIIELTQRKTKNKVFIPVLSDNLERLLAKYDYDVPHVSDVVLNRYIKEILCELSSSVPSLAKEERTTLTMQERDLEERGERTFRRDAKGYVIKPRWAMVSTHTARRTGITLLYKSGLFDTLQIMHVSGHRDTRTFKEYIKLSGKEVADGIAETVKKRNINPF